MREASAKRTTVRVASARSFTSSPVAAGSRMSSASTPTIRPAAVNTIAGVIDVPSMRPEIAAKPSRMAARTASCQCCIR